MEGIYYQNGVYVLVDNVTMNDNCLFNYRTNTESLLYGGRIKIQTADTVNGYFFVDGIRIFEIYSLRYSDGSLSRYVDYHIDTATIVAHLNAIEANGVDAFKEHYKKSIQFLYEEVKEQLQKSELLLTAMQDDSKVEELLKEVRKIRDILFEVLVILFSLHTYMSAGLENEKVISAWQTVMDSLI